MPVSPQNKNVFLLSGAQALFQTGAVLLITVSGLVGFALAPDKSLATLPLALMTLAAAATMIPAALFMQRHGRRAGFLLGAMTGMAAGLTGAFAIAGGSFGLFILANMFAGCYQAFAQYYRFAAADAAAPEFKSRAISWVIAGGVIAAVAGPNIVRFTQDIGEAPFAASFVAMFMLGTIAFVLLTRLRLPVEQIVQAGGPARPLVVIMRQPVFLTALAGSAIGFAVMVMVMTATPLAMQAHHHPVDAAATVIQWHVLGMFVPSFFTGNLIRRFGVLKIMGTGVLLLAGHVAIALSGIALWHFLSGLVLLGVGWNFLFIGGSTLLTEAYRPSERGRTQAAHDFLMFGAITLASFSSGSLLHAFGWRTVNLVALPLLAIAMSAILGYALLRARPAVVAE